MSLKDDIPILLESQKLDSTNFGTWSFKMMTILEVKDLIGVVSGKETRPIDPALVAAWEAKDLKARAMLKLNVKDSVVVHIKRCTTSAEIWATLTSTFASTNVPRIMMLRNRLNSLRKAPDQPIEEYLSKIKELNQALADIDQEVPDEELARITMLGLDPSFDAFVMNINIKDVFPSFDKLCGFLILECERRALAQSPPNSAKVDQALMMKGPPAKDKKKAKGKKKAEASDDDDSTSKRKGNEKKGKGSKATSKTTCGHCKRTGHTEEQCYKKAFDERESAKKAQSSNFAGSSEPSTSPSEDQVFVHTLYSGNLECDNHWWLDSGASNHMTGERRMFSTLGESSTGKSVITGDNSEHPVEGIGEVSLRSIDGGRKVFKHVLHVPGIAKNLISVGQIVEQGYQLRFTNDGCFIEDPSNDMKVVAKGVKEGRLFRFIADIPHQANATTSMEDEESLWHKRLGHISYDGLRALKHNSMVDGLPSHLRFVGKGHVCTACQLGKQSRSKFPESNTRSEGILDLIHSDIWGPAQLSSLGGNRYFVTFVDDCSRKMWIYFVKLKSQAFDVFLNFQKMVELESGRKIKILRTDGGGEYASRAFDDYCATNGIQRQYTCSYTPQQNGVAERRNRILLEHARAMIAERNLPKSFWAEAVYTAAYIYNRSPMASLQRMTPEEAYSGKKPFVRHLRVFGCICYVHVPDEKRRKLDDKAVKCIFVGYSTEKKGFKCWDPDCKKLLVSRNVVFNEGSSYYDEGATPSSPPPIPDLEEPKKEGVALPSQGVSCDDSQHSDENPSPSCSPSSSSNPTLRRSTRLRKPIDRLRYDSHYAEQHVAFMANVGNTIEPQCYEEAAKEKVWQDAMDEEHSALIDNNTWELVDLPPKKKPIGCRWVYKVKYQPDGRVDKYKARLVARGFSQRQGIDYKETFSPVAKMSTIRLIVALATMHGWKLHQMDVKNAYLNGVLDEEVYMHQPPGYIDENHPTKVCRLVRALYGLKQAGRQWYKQLHKFFTSNGFVRSLAEPTLYARKDQHGIVVCVVYVDDLIISGDDTDGIKTLKGLLSSTFEMKDLKELHYCLGLEVLRTSNYTFLLQHKYMEGILRKFSMEDCKPVSTPLEQNFRFPDESSDSEVDANRYRQLVGSLIYLTITRPDISFAVNVVSQFMQKPRESHLRTARRILRYIKGTLNFGIRYDGNNDLHLYGYTDVDWAGNQLDRRSTSGYAFYIGSGAVSFSCKKQPTVALSSTEAEY